jgi:hypothetical protein
MHLFWLRPPIYHAGEASEASPRLSPQALARREQRFHGSRNRLAKRPAGTASMHAPEPGHGQALQHGVFTAVRPDPSRRHHSQRAQGEGALRDLHRRKDVQSTRCACPAQKGMSPRTVRYKIPLTEQPKRSSTESTERLLARSASHRGQFSPLDFEVIGQRSFQALFFFP